MIVVSIHALLAECDMFSGGAGGYVVCFNPRTPCGVRPPYSFVPSPVPRFQSTHSLRSATGQGIRFPRRFHVSIHALLAECDLRMNKLRLCHTSFNPRTPCGVRLQILKGGGNVKRFQSTHSLRSATYTLPDGRPRLAVSIHALLAECD